MMALQSSADLKIREDPLHKNKGPLSVSKKVIYLGRHFYTNDIHYNKCIIVKTHARIISDALQSGKGHCQEIGGATIHTNNMHYNKCITVKTHTQIINDGVTIK